MSRRPSLVDRALGALGLQRRPQAPARRMRVSADFQGALHTRLTASWLADTESINSTLRWQLQTLRNRARWLAANNGYAKGFVRAVADNVVGPKGIQLRAEIRTRTGTFATATNDAIEAAWAQWGDPATCDAARRNSWLDTQRLIAATWAVDGECFVRLWPGFGNDFGFAVQVLDTDLVDETLNVSSAPGVNEIRMGVELDQWGGAVAYHVLTKHPAETSTRERIRIPASQMLHLFVQDRPGQVRGIPPMAVMLSESKLLDSYMEAALVAAQVGAAHMGFLIPGPDAVVDEQSPPVQQFSAAPGIWRELPPGYTVADHNPAYPNTDMGEFVGTILRSIARGLGVSDMTLTGDLSGANYSSMRAGQGPERDAWRALHHWMAARIHMPVYRAWLPMALLAGRVGVDTRLASDYQAVTFRGRGWLSVDPLKDIQAWERRIHLGAGSRTRLLAETGEDYEEIVDELREEQEYADAEGVPIAGVDAAVPTTPGATDDAPAPAQATRRPALRGLRRLSGGAA